jgi:hypothetical protein
VSRWILLALLAVGSTTHAERVVIRGPALAFTCPSLRTWDAVAECIKQRGWTSKVWRTTGRAKLVEVNAPADRFEAVHQQQPDVALYIQEADGRWQLGGLFEVGMEQQYEVLDFQPTTIAHTNGYRFEVGTRTQTATTLDSVTTRPSVLLMKHVFYCSGADYRCTEVIPSCDALVDGHMYSTFHGDIVLADRQVRVTGDGTLADPMCLGPQQQELAWN